MVWAAHLQTIACFQALKNNQSTLNKFYFQLYSQSRTGSGHPWLFLIEISFKWKLFFMQQEKPFSTWLIAWNVNVWFIYKTVMKTQGVVTELRGKSPNWPLPLQSHYRQNWYWLKGVVHQWNVTSVQISSRHAMRKINQLLKSNSVEKTKQKVQKAIRAWAVWRGGHNTAFACY